MTVQGFNSLPAQTRLLVFDADDTLRRTTVAGKPCPHAPGEWELLPGVRETLRRVDWRGGALLLGVASNQDQIAYGHLSEAMARRLLCAMLIEATGCAMLKAVIALCPHALELDCACRKPQPGMLLSIMRAHRVTPAQTVFVGDAETDREAARRAGVAFIHARDFFKTGERS